MTPLAHLHFVQSCNFNLNLETDKLLAQSGLCSSSPAPSLGDQYWLNSRCHLTCLAIIGPKVASANYRWYAGLDWGIADFGCLSEEVLWNYVAPEWVLIWEMFTGHLRQPCCCCKVWYSQDSPASMKPWRFVWSVSSWPVDISHKACMYTWMQTCMGQRYTAVLLNGFATWSSLKHNHTASGHQEKERVQRHPFPW